jgi:hypothetical protein
MGFVLLHFYAGSHFTDNFYYSKGSFRVRIPNTSNRKEMEDHNMIQSA